MIGKDRQLAFLILRDIEERSAWSNLALNARIGSGGADDPAFIRELVYGVLRSSILLDSNLDRFLSRPGLRSSDRLLLRMGFYQIAFMDSVTDYAAVSETVELAKRFAKGRERLVNAVLRNFLREGGKLIVPADDRGEIAYSCRPWIAELWRSAYGEEVALSLLKNSNQPAELALRVNTLKGSREELLECLPGSEPGSGIDTAVLARGGLLTGSDLYKQGRFSIQSRMSQYAVQLLDPKPGETLIDLCAAPGGKSCAAAERMQDRGRVYAFDLHEKRVGLIEKEAVRLGITSIKAACHDAREPLPSLEGKADCVLCDVPCSALGTIRRRPEIKLREMPEDLSRLPGIQLDILKNGASLTGPGGRLLYATCTIDPTENEAVTGAFLQGDRRFERIYEKQFFPQEMGDGFYLCLMQKKD